MNVALGAGDHASRSREIGSSKVNAGAIYKSLCDAYLSKAVVIYVYMPAMSLLTYPVTRAQCTHVDATYATILWYLSAAWHPYAVDCTDLKDVGNTVDP